MHFTAIGSSTNALPIASMTGSSALIQTKSITATTKTPLAVLTTTAGGMTSAVPS